MLSPKMLLVALTELLLPGTSSMAASNQKLRTQPYKKMSPRNKKKLKYTKIKRPNRTSREDVFLPFWTERIYVYAIKRGQLGKCYLQQLPGTGSLSCLAGLRALTTTQHT